MKRIVAVVLLAVALVFAAIGVGSGWLGVDVAHGPRTVQVADPGLDPPNPF